MHLRQLWLHMGLRKGLTTPLDRVH